ncbi:MAG TPA: hypothetical protein VL307_14760, partial [Chitinophagaceae bacterium]|nr:hypothetical protein [Chitinophagaceae bacterium]
MKHNNISLPYSLLSAIFIILTLFTLPIKAQQTPAATPAWERSLLLRKGVETKDDKDKPALFSLTWPQDGKPNSYLINAALAADFTWLKTNGGKFRRLEITPSIGYNRN